MTCFITSIPSRILVRCGELRSRGGDLIEGYHSLEQAETIYASQNDEIDVVAHKISLGLFHHFKQEWPIELKVYEGATELVDHLYTNNDILTKCQIRKIQLSQRNPLFSRKVVPAKIFGNADTCRYGDLSCKWEEEDGDFRVIWICFY